MRIIILSNLLTPHQVPLCQAFLHIVGNDNLFFIETQSRNEISLPQGWKYTGATPACVITLDTFSANRKKYEQFILSADVVIFGSAPYELIINRLISGKPTFLYSERIYKQPCPLWQIPLRAIKYYWKWGRFSCAYLLCASAYTASDYAKTGTFRGKAYKWGYFPEVKEYDLEQLFSRKQENKKPSLLWAGRLIDWKHPDDAIVLARRLKEQSYSFDMNIIGTGVMEKELNSLIAEYHLQDCVHMLGAMPPAQVRSYMEQADIFLFTSDRQEGWGAVLNESMNSGCAVVASHAIGSVPFLIKQAENGIIYESGNLESLYAAIKKLLDHPNLCRNYGENAYYTILSQWNAKNAAEQLLMLMEALNTEKKYEIHENGPCSVALPIPDNWFRDNT